MKWEAACHPIRCGSSSDPAASVVTPRVTNGTLSRAPSAIHTMSQWGRIVAPMPSPNPFTAASSGLSNASSTGIRPR